MRSVTLFLLVSVLSLVTACYPASKPVIFHEEVRDWTPIGTPVAEAASIMRSRGFSVLHHEPSTATDQEYLSCSKYRVSPGSGVETRWTALLLIQDGHVAGIETDVDEG